MMLTAALENAPVSDTAAISAAGYLGHGQDFTALLDHVVSLPPSREAFLKLGGTVAMQINNSVARYPGARNRQLKATASSPPLLSDVAFRYLQAVARHLPAEAAATAGTSLDAQRNLSYSSTTTLNQVLEAVGNAATCCEPRSLITQSGILPAMASMVPSCRSATVVPISRVQVEFLQVCIYACQYRYCASHVLLSWPRPVSSTQVCVTQVLRYYYLRGTVCLGCQDWSMARRCFWTCLSIPADPLMVSAIAIAAWKKLMLLQCRMMCLEDTSVNATHLFTLPAVVPTGISRFLDDALARNLTKSSHKSFSRNNSDKSVDAKTFNGNAHFNLEENAPSLLAAMGGDTNEENPKDMMQMMETNSDDEEHSQEVIVIAGSDSGGGSDIGKLPLNSSSFPSLGVKVYGELVVAYARRNQSQIILLMRDYEHLLRSDGNWGLTRQVAEQSLRRQVVFWSKIYAAISLTDLALKLNVSTERIEAILSSISDELAWSIQTRDGIVYFPPTPSSETTVSKEDLIQLTRMVQMVRGSD